MALGRSLCISMVVAVSPALAAGGFVEGGNGGSCCLCEGIALP